LVHEFIAWIGEARQRAHLRLGRACHSDERNGRYCTDTEKHDGLTLRIFLRM
jgi:hypothetical protein